MKQIKIWLKLLRVKHYIKNIIVFFPLFFSGKLFSGDFDRMGLASLGFLGFSMMASAVYIINDIFDEEKDRLHPKKRNRPIASGKISRRSAIVVALFLVVGAMSSLVLGGAKSDSIMILGFYLMINIFYSAGLKNIQIVDIAILSSGFLLRLLFGSAILDIEISALLYLTVLSGSFYLGVTKRYKELLGGGEKTRTVLGKYSADFLRSKMDLFLLLSVVFYSMWCMEKPEEVRFYFLWSVPILILIVLQYTYALDKSEYGDPTDTIMEEKSIWPTIVIFVIYLGILVTK